MDLIDLIELLASWEVIYAVMLLPAILLLGNFVFGSCFVSELLGREQHTTDSLHTRYRIIGRGCVVLIVLSFVWQYYAFLFLARPDITGRTDVATCNPLYFIWDVVDALPSLPRLAVLRRLVNCTWDEVVFHVLFTGFAITYAKCVFSVPQVSVSAPPPKPPTGAPSHARSSEQVTGKDTTDSLEAGEVRVSRCRKCAASVRGMDHHCYMIGNCVGEVNRPLFITCLRWGVVELSYLFWRCAHWAWTEGGLVLHAGLVLTTVFDLFLLVLLLFQEVLHHRGYTTLRFLKETGNGRWARLRRFVELLL